MSRKDNSITNPLDQEMNNEKRRTVPKLTLDADDEARSVSLSFDAEDQIQACKELMTQLSIQDNAIFTGILTQIVALGESSKEVSPDAANFITAFAASVEPQDQIETLLATQMAATHQSIMMMGRRMMRAETLSQQDAAERAFNKLCRTFTTQMTALKKHQANAPQNVLVEHVEVTDGGQAIVGHVHHSNRG